MVTVQVLIVVVAAQILVVSAQNCGPKADGAICTDGNCCSSHGWCGKTEAHCDLKTCLGNFSDPISICYKYAAGELSEDKAYAAPSSSNPAFSSRLPFSLFGIGSPYERRIPDVDQCGRSVNITCPGAGKNGYFYRCCSSAGHCGPKNDIQDQALYCGVGCQDGYGDCNPKVKKPSPPKSKPRIVTEGTCGPIVNARCAPGLCCSGSNFCGVGEDYCGAANWCQPDYGDCN